MSTLRNPDVDDPQAELRAEFKRTMKARRRARRERQDRGMTLLEAEQLLPRIDWCRFATLRCGARTKSGGTPCKLTGLYDNGRCRLHGGLSTGPRTAEGKARSARNGGRKGTNEVPGGKVIDLVTMNGKLMAGMQALAKKVDLIENQLEAA